MQHRRVAPVEYRDSAAAHSPIAHADREDHAIAHAHAKLHSHDTAPHSSFRRILAHRHAVAAGRHLRAASTKLLVRCAAPRVPYLAWPEVHVPRVRGWIMLPILFYHTILILSPSTAASDWIWRGYDLMFEVHLVFAAWYHLNPITRWEVSLRKADLAAIIITGACMLWSVLSRMGVEASYLYALLILTMILSPWATRHNAINIACNILLPTVGAIGVLSLSAESACTPLAGHVRMNLLAVCMAGSAYLIEMTGLARMKNTWAGWHDVFHAGITGVYIHRLWYIREILIH
jgi:hypothetical protein